MGPAVIADTVQAHSTRHLRFQSSPFHPHHWVGLTAPIRISYMLLLTGMILYISKDLFIWEQTSANILKVRKLNSTKFLRALGRGGDLVDM